MFKVGQRVLFTVGTGPTRFKVGRVVAAYPAAPYDHVWLRDTSDPDGVERLIPVRHCKPLADPMAYTQAALDWKYPPRTDDQDTPQWRQVALELGQ